jgi:hypothetical protein
MKPIAFSLLIGAMCAGLLLAVAADSKTSSNPPSTRFFVTVQGRMTSALGGPLEATLTFSDPVELPKVRLRAGTYVFRIVAPNTMRVSSADGKKVYATFTTTPVTRTRSLDQPLVSFDRSAPDKPPRLLAIYPEHARVGFQPLFQSAAKQANSPVATTGTE